MSSNFDRATIHALPCFDTVPHAVTRTAFADMVAARGVAMDPTAVGIVAACYADVSVFDRDKVAAYEDAAAHAVRCIAAKRKVSQQARDAVRSRAPAWRGAPTAAMDKEEEEE